MSYRLSLLIKFPTLLLLGFACAFLNSCVTSRNVPLTDSRAQGLRSQEIATSNRKLPDFGVMTPDKALFGMIGAVATVIEGNARVRSADVKDPAIKIANELASALAGKYGAKIVSSSRRVQGESSSAIALTYPEADYIVDVRTINWSTIYLPLNWVRYRIIYSTKLRLIEVKTGKVLSEGFFAYMPTEKERTMHLGEMWENDAARLKAELDRAAEAAVAHFKRETLRI